VSLTDVRPGGLGLVFVSDVVEEEEVRDDPFADGPDVLPAEGAVGLLSAEGRGTLVLVPVEV